MAIDKIGGFTVLATLGAGAHSSILHIRREEDGREYALKVVNIDAAEDKKFLDQARHEYRVGQMFSHPNLIRVYALDLEKGLFGFGAVKKAKLLLEFAKGTTLDAAKILKPAKLLRVFEKVAAALVHMHLRGVCHADLKPNNIMVGRGAAVKVLDYGLAWVKGEPKDRVQGTVEYMAPETAEHKMVNERTDIFNLGATMYRLVTLQLPPSVLAPMDGVKMSEKTYKAAYRPVTSLNPGCPPAFADLIHQCMAFKALGRPESMAVVHAELERLADAAEAKLDPAELEE
jgi:eukaryotic-like serine/threonine-protein kinase